jgi:DNA-binding NarL/FixJ family response regulator
MVCMPAVAYEDEDDREFDGEAAWMALWAGEWRVVEHEAMSHHHAIVCEPVPGRPIAAPLLTVAEVSLASRFARGVPLKAIAADDGRPTAATRKCLAEVKRKLMIKNEAQLVVLFGGTDHDRVPTPPGLRATITGFGSGERLRLQYRWPASRLPPTLSNAERTVVLDLIDGVSREAIAHARGTSPRTVANQMASIFRKLGVGSRVELLVALFAQARQPAVRRVGARAPAA